MKPVLGSGFSTPFGRSNATPGINVRSNQPCSSKRKGEPSRSKIVRGARLILISPFSFSQTRGLRSRAAKIQVYRPVTRGAT